jgi:hypothetical protein
VTTAGEFPSVFRGKTSLPHHSNPRLLAASLDSSRSTSLSTTPSSVTPSSVSDSDSSDSEPSVPQPTHYQTSTSTYTPISAPTSALTFTPISAPNSTLVFASPSTHTSTPVSVPIPTLAPKPRTTMSATFTTLRIPMPIPRTANAPYFNGTYVTDFLSLVTQHATNAGITDFDNVVSYIYQYSSDEVKDIIRYMPEFDPDVTNKTWNNAKTALVALFGSTDEPPKVNEDHLKKYCRESSERPAFASKQEVDKYNQGFQKLAAPLLKQGVITEKQRDYYFITGIPSAIREWFILQVPEPQRTRANPPEVAESVKYLYRRHDTNSLLYDIWRQDPSQRRMQGDESTSRATNNFPPMPFETSTSPYNQPSTSFGPISSSYLEDLSRKLAEMTLNKITAQINNLNPRIDAPSVAGPSTSQPSPQPFLPRPRRCFICGKSGDELRHALHPSRCDETPGLLQDQLIIYSTDRNRYTLPNGEDLPLIGGYPGGVAAFLRSQANTKRSIQRDLPPHMDNSTPNQVVRANTIELLYGGQDVLQGDVFAVSSLPSSVYVSNPALRSGKDTTVRFDPTQRPEPKGKVKEDITNRQPKPPISTVFPPVPGPSKDKKVEVPTPPNPINRPDGWRQSLPSRTQMKDVEMGDQTRRTTTGPTYHFTSDVQERADPSKMLEAIMQTTVTVPIYQAIGLSPSLQKLFGEATRTRRTYTSKTATYLEEEPETDDTSAGDSEVHVASNLYAQNFERLPEFLLRYSNAITSTPTRKFFAMTTGTISVTMGGAELVAMIDNGSELNLAGNDVPDRTGAAVDFEGMKWSLKGIHGGPEQLQGVITDASLKIAGHDFPHHFFVSNQSLGRHDLILGQPFLQWYATRFDYDRSGVVKMYLWKEGNRTDRNKPTLCMTITDPQDPRNTTAIDRTAHHSHLARIEEVDEDFQE